MPVFTHRFPDDLKAIDWFGEPFALARFGDGELACIEGKPHRPYAFDMGTETWSGDRKIPLRKMLHESILADVDGYCVGVPPACCQGHTRARALDLVRSPSTRQTYATLFCFGNHARFESIVSRDRLRERCALVSGRGGDIEVPLDAINRSDWLEPTLEKMFRLDRPIMVAAGPAACILVHQYWMRAPDRQVVVDIGSALDTQIWGRGTRWHTVANNPSRYHDCTLHGRSPCHDHCSPSRF